MNRYRRASAFKGHSIPVASFLIIVSLLSAGSVVYGRPFFSPMDVTVTSTIFTTTTNWVTSTVLSTVTQTISGLSIVVTSMTSTSTTTVTGVPRTPKVVTVNGAARISTVQSKFGGASGLFSGGYLSLANSADWNFGTGEFTVDWWFRASRVTGDDGMFQLNSGNGAQLAIAIYASKIWIQGYGGTPGSYGPTLTTNSWHHFAAVRSVNTMSFYLDGSSIYSFNCAGQTYSNGGNLLWIGMYASTSHVFSGWLDEFQVSKGTARWTSGFTTPTGAYAGDSNTVLLLHMDEADGSATFNDG